MTPKEAAKKLGTNAGTIRRWCARGRLPGATILLTANGTERWEIPETALRHFVKRGPGRPSGVRTSGTHVLVKQAISKGPMTTAQIASMLKCSPQVVLYHLRALGAVKLGGKRSAWTIPAG